ncbi:putative kinetochore protein Sos7 [Septoria linicola]|nr:putative kinetochore protein Sos7 [Septoria linicola]
MDVASALEQLRKPQKLSILHLSEPLITNTADKDSQSQQNTSYTQLGTSPSSLSTDLVHYRELFSKLRFSYVEQVTKERFLRAVVAAQPEFVSAEENAELEERLKTDKDDLKAKKEEVRGLIDELEAQARSLAQRYEHIQLRTAQLESLPSEITELESTIQRLQDAQEPKSEDAEMSLPLNPTLDLLRQREQEAQTMDLEIARLQAALPAKKAEVQRMQDELAPIQMRKIKAVEEAQEARKRREGGGGGADELEEKGRWLRGVETTMKAMLEV